MRPTESELEILHLLWAESPLTVRQVNDQLNAQRSQQSAGDLRSGKAPRDAAGYTTTLKIMQIMFEKGLVFRQEEGRTHTYTPAVAQSDTESLLLDQFMHNTFKGSAGRLVLQALGQHDATPEELDEIKALIAKLENKQ
ncbi:MAG: BlaI/MecI/CopY family transcriptional regulator [Saprospiraceae bacterium]|nr:BlaI/MecI/CopY family transcriptional regulator [Saprospiraceae bacterium]